MNDIKSYTPDFDKPVEHLKEEFKGLRTGRANAALVEGIQVEAYESMTPLSQVASISVPDARSILITPWDATILKNIETAITNSNLGANPMNEGNAVRIALPELTEESRKGLVKIIGEKAEAARMKIRGLRDKIKDEIQKAEKAKEITEDDRYDMVEQLDNLTKEYNKKIQDLASHKEEEVMKI